jgi:hypothetical protein
MGSLLETSRFAKPFAGYRDFAHCVSENQDKSNPEAYCAAIEQQVGKMMPSWDLWSSGDMYHLGKNLGSLDNLRAFDSGSLSGLYVHEVEELLPVLKAAARSVTSGGSIIFSCDNEGDLTALVRDSEMLGKLFEGVHLDSVDGRDWWVVRRTDEDFQEESHPPADRPSVKKITHDAAGFLDGDRGLYVLKCEDCIFYYADHLACELVEGAIDPTDTCDLFRKTLGYEDDHDDGSSGEANTSKAVTLLPDLEAAPVAVAWSDRMAKAADTARYTMTVVYKASPGDDAPKFDDAHDEFTDADELFQASLGYLESNPSRNIYLQHGMSEFGQKLAGRWVHLMPWPFQVKAKFTLPTGEVQDETIPAGSVYMGIIWEPWSHDLVKQGLLRGLSFGGRARRWTAKMKER